MPLKDKDIRESLFEYLETKIPKIRILEEKNIGNSRADVFAIVEKGTLGIEIKSDVDTYARLQKQVVDYDRFYDFNAIVVGQRHAVHVHEHIPDYWGIIVVEEGEQGNHFTIQRPIHANPNVCLKDSVSLLWRPELSRIQEKYKLPAYKGKSKEFVREKVLEKMDPDILHEELIQTLFERDYTTIFDEINEYRIANGQKKRRRRRVKRVKRSRYDKSIPVISSTSSCD